jgi:hypothetical protein
MVPDGTSIVDQWLIGMVRWLNSSGIRSTSARFARLWVEIDEPDFCGFGATFSSRKTTRAGAEVGIDPGFVVQSFW